MDFLGRVESGFLIAGSRTITQKSFSTMPGAHSCHLNQNLNSEQDFSIRILWKAARRCSQVSGGINSTVKKVRIGGTSEIIIVYKDSISFRQTNVPKDIPQDANS